MLSVNCLISSFRRGRFNRGNQYHRSAVALGHSATVAQAAPSIRQSGADRRFNRQKVSVLFGHRRYHDLLGIRSADMEGNSLIFNSELSAIDPDSPTRIANILSWPKCNELR